MTKLFSMKSLAFAGAAAFALTLVAAPKADAADAKIVDAWEDWGYDYIEGDIGLQVDGDLTTTADGEVIYYQVGKDDSKIKDGKYTAIADESRGKFNFSKFFGKDQILSLSTTGKKADAVSITITAAPKVKVKYDASKQGLAGVDLTIDNAPATITTKSGIQAIASGKTYDVYGLDEEGDFAKKNLVFGGTVEIKVKENLGERKKGDPIKFSSTSKVAKMKISAKAKAPKIALKLDATKAFSWKISSKQEYIIRLQGSNKKVSKWAGGSNAADNWATIIGKVENDELKDIVTGDAITKDITISLRTAAVPGKKAASAINVISLKKSAASPTTSAITIETTKAANPDKNGKFKVVTGASIKANVENVQYSTDKGVKWKKLSNTKATKLKTTEKDVLVRVVTPSKTGTVLPSLNTAVTWDTETGVATISPFDYNGDTVIAGTTTTVQAK